MATRLEADRLVKAILQNLDAWIEDVGELESGEPTGTTAKRRALHILRNMVNARVSLRRLAGETDAEALRDSTFPPSHGPTSRQSPL